MPVSESPKSSAGRWIIGVMLAVVLYVGSADPVKIFLESRDGVTSVRSGRRVTTTILCRVVSIPLYQPAYWLLAQPGLQTFHEGWRKLWKNIFY